MDSSGVNWGGARTGAGRKPGPNVRVSISLPREIWAGIEAKAATLGTTPEQEAARLLVTTSDSR